MLFVGANENVTFQVNVIENVKSAREMLYPDAFKHDRAPAATVTHNDENTAWKTPYTGLSQFPNSICRNVKWRAALLFRQKWPQTIETKKAQQKLF